MEQDERINIVILGDDNKPKEYFSLIYQGFLNMPHVGETLIIKLGESEETKLHKLIVTQIEHRWATNRKTSGFLSSCDNYIWCKYENYDTP